MTCGFDRPHAIKRDVSHVTKYPGNEASTLLVNRKGKQHVVHSSSHCLDHLAGSPARSSEGSLSSAQVSMKAYDITT